MTPITRNTTPRSASSSTPWSAFPAGIAETNHYPSYPNLLKKLDADPVFFPTEMLHGNYDGGAGAGLSDY